MCRLQVIWAAQSGAHPSLLQQSLDASLALGSAISVACGFEKKGVAVIGDFAMAHSGILGLINAATSGCNVLVLVLQNEIAAMTGGQEAPDLRRVVKASTPTFQLSILMSISKNRSRIQSFRSLLQNSRSL